MPEIIRPDFPIVGIGASAGGLKAIESLLEAIPPNSGMAFIIVQHLSRRYKSLMKEILIKDTDMPVVMAEQGMEVEKDHVYLIPPGDILTISDGFLSLEIMPDDQGSAFVIDQFFHSLGQYAQESSIAIVLSGTGSDGSRGLMTIKEWGGIVMVQEPSSGDFDGMPLNAIGTQVVDFVFTPEGIAEKLVALSKIEKEKRRNTGKANADPISHTIPIDLGHILDLIIKYHGVDFTMYKKATIKRRIEKHMSQHNFNDLGKYFTFLLKNSKHIKELYQEMLIGVTEFFRDAEAYQMIKDTILPELFHPDRLSRELRIWVCGCSTGEEAYSLAILFDQFTKNLEVPVKYTVLATDIDERAIAIASKGQYNAVKLESLPDGAIDTYFSYTGEVYEIKSFIRERIIFARNDVTVDPPFINLDLISCRNLLIYLSASVQRRILLNFHFGLKPGGYLWLGPSENIQDLKTNFITKDDKWRVFMTAGRSSNSRLFFRRNSPNDVSNKELKTSTLSSHLPKFSSPKKKLPNYSKILLDRYSPCCVLIDSNFNLLYLAGGVGKYLHLPDRELNNDLLAMISQAMVTAIRDGVTRLMNEEGPILYPDIQVYKDQKKGIINIKMAKIEEYEKEPIFLIEWVDEEAENGLPASKLVVNQKNIDSDALQIIKGLQDELNFAHIEIQSGLQEIETSNEELQATNEELLAANEELQSTNEELQSVNEELYTVNSELQARNKELTEANSTIDSLFSNNAIGILFLNVDLEILIFTPGIRQILELVETDIGTHIDKFKFKWEYPDLMNDLSEVLNSGKVIRKTAARIDRREYFLIHIYPHYNRNQIAGVVLNLIDIKDLKEVSQLQQS